MSDTLGELLQKFWSWAGLSAEDYSRLTNASEVVVPFHFPEFDMIREKCFSLINTDMNDEEISDFLTCLALDEEGEIILDWCKDIANTTFLMRLVSKGVNHMLADVRWQIAELLCFRDVPQGREVILKLCEDEHPYVRKRAQYAAANGTGGTGDGSVVP